MSSAGLAASISTSVIYRQKQISCEAERNQSDTNKSLENKLSADQLKDSFFRLSGFWKDNTAWKIYRKSHQK